MRGTAEKFLLAEYQKKKPHHRVRHFLLVELVGAAWQPLIAELKGWRDFGLEFKSRRLALNLAEKVAA